MNPDTISQKLRRLQYIYPAQNLALAASYMLAGGLGLSIAVPPGYATLIWPASGIAVGCLILFGWRLWPGVFLGAFVLNFIVGGGLQSEALGSTITVAALIAVGSTLQSLLAARFAIWRFGAPMRFKRAREIILFTLIVGPLACCIAPTVGVLALYHFGIVPGESAAENWLTWWIGDFAGVLIFLPIMLFGPWRPWGVYWRGQLLAGFTSFTLLATLVPLAATFYAWKATSDIADLQNRQAFEALAEESERALTHRMENYRLALDGGAGLFRASNLVTAKEWRTYVSQIDLQGSLPGINGVGYIEPTRRGDLDAFAAEMARWGLEDLTIHPETEADELFVIVLIEPLAPNLTAQGLDIAFETNRYEAATHSRDTGQATITRRILLVQDDTASPGFLLLRPLYEEGVPLETVADRRKAFRGWVYAPFIGNRFLAALTQTQGVSLDISVYDGDAAVTDNLIYSSIAEGDTHKSIYRVERTLRIEERNWTVVWQSTADFEVGVHNKEPLIILISGVALSLLIGALMLSFARREEAISSLVEQKTLAIQARERENRSIVDTAVVGILLTDTDLRVLAANSATLSLFGMEEEAIVGKPLNTLIGGINEDSLSVLREETVEDDIAISFSAIGKDKSGKPLHLDLNINSWYTENGALRLTVVIRDVTAEKMVLDTLEATERRWHRALRGAEIGVYDIDLPSGKSIVSDTWKTLLGFDPDDDIDPQREFLSRVHPEDLPLIDQADSDLKAGRTDRSVSEFRIWTKDGRMVWLRSDGFIAERDAQDTPLRMVGTLIDVTSLRNATAALKVSEERFRSAIENAPAGMALLDPAGQILLANAELARFLKVDVDTLPEKCICDLGLPNEDERAALQSWLDSDGSEAKYHGECAFVRPDGTEVWGLVSASRAPAQGDADRYLVAQILDITESREIDKMKDEFVATVSHELRTPLVSIRGALGLVCGTMASELPAQADKLLQIALRNCDQLVMLVNDILDLEKLTSRRYELHLEDHDLSEQIQIAVETNQAYAQSFDVQLEHAQQPMQNAVVTLDAARFQQVMSNLLSNAAKFSPKGGKVDIAATMRGDKVRVSVRDHGPGIPLEFRDRVFDRFSQADNSSTRDKGGTGLGLPISKQMVELMDGVIGFDSALGEGTTFWLDFPVKSVA